MPLFLGDEELGKKDDDHKSSKTSPLAASWQHRKAPLRRNLKRILLGAGGLYLCYLFFKHMPTDVKQINTNRPQYGVPGNAAGNTVHIIAPAGGANTVKNDASPAHLPASQVKNEHYFDGPIKFYQLASSLHAASLATSGNVPSTKNVIYAAASLKSAAALIPMACEMAIHKRNFVHFALLGRDEVAMDMLKAINSVDKNCDITFHDARPDFSLYSTDERMGNSASAALSHMNDFLHPQAVIVDNSDLEEIWFLKAFRDRSALIGKTLIELPKDAAQNMMWFTRLDFASLNGESILHFNEGAANSSVAWNKISIDIVIHAQPAASGSLIRLLTSLWKADYFSSTPPKLTIELPQEIDEPTDQFLQSFQWPPSNFRSEGNANQLTLHRRIPQHGLTADENSIRLVESFWPTNPFLSHILVLSPHVELSPLYFHYLKYVLLEYHYSFAVFGTPIKLLGISLDLPTTYLNDSTAFTSPSKSTSFLWNSPNSNAALYLGSSWKELHSLVSHSLQSSHQLPTPTTLNSKQVSKTYPAWLEHIFRLARARGYTMLYPKVSAVGEALATVHHELYQAPEEYNYAMNPDHKPLDKATKLPDISEEMIADPKEHLSLKQPETKVIKGNLLDSYFSNKALPSLVEMKSLSWDGREMTLTEASLETMDFASTFRREIGGCKVGEAPPLPREGEAIDLFCFDTVSDDTASGNGAILGRSGKYQNQPAEALTHNEQALTSPELGQSASTSTSGAEKEAIKPKDGDAPKKPSTKILIDESAAPFIPEAGFPHGDVPQVAEWDQRHVHGATKIPGTGLGAKKDE